MAPRVRFRLSVDPTTRGRSSSSSYPTAGQPDEEWGESLWAEEPSSASAGPSPIKAAVRDGPAVGSSQVSKPLQLIPSLGPRRNMSYVFPEPPYPVRKFIALTRDEPATADKPAGPALYPASRRWARVRDVWLRVVHVPGGMTPFDPADLWTRFWRHTGGRMPQGQAALLFSLFLDSPIIRCLEEVPAVRYLEAFLSHLLGRPSSVVREAELFVHRGCYSHWIGFNEYFARDFADEARFRDTRHVANGWHHFEALGLRKCDRRDMYWVVSQSWRQEWDVARALGVASPLVTVYEADFLKKTEGNAR